VILSIDVASGKATILAGRASKSGSRDGVSTDAEFDAPAGLAVDGHGNLFVADTNNSTVRAIDLSLGSVTTLAGKPGILGANDGIQSEARFAYPQHIVTDGAGELWVSDSLNNTIRHLDVATGRVTTAIGTSAVFGVELGPLPAQLFRPAGIALTHEGAGRCAIGSAGSSSTGRPTRSCVTAASWRCSPRCSTCCASSSSAAAGS